MEQWLSQEKRLEARRAQHWQRRLDAMLRTELMRRARGNGFDTTVTKFHAARIASGQQDPWQLVAQLTEKVFSPRKLRLRIDSPRTTFSVPGARCPALGARRSVPGARCPALGARRSVPGAAVPGARCSAPYLF